MRKGRMHQTTVRFSPDIWQALEDECARLGVSVAQYLREAAVARLAFVAGRRGEMAEYEAALVGAGVTVEPGVSSHWTVDLETAGEIHQSAREQVLAASAVTAQSHQAWRRAREARARAVELRRQRKEKVR